MQHHIQVTAYIRHRVQVTASIRQGISAALGPIPERMRFSIVEDPTGFMGVVSTVEGFMEGDSMEGVTEGTGNGQGLTVRVRLGNGSQARSAWLPFRLVVSLGCRATC